MSMLVDKLCDLHSELHVEMGNPAGVHVFYDDRLQAMASLILDAATVADKYARYRRERDGWRFKRGDRVKKTKGSSWHGVVVGFYSTELTPRGYVVESEREPGSCQLYPEGALEYAEATE